MSKPLPLVIGQTFTIESRVLSEVRRLNVYHPPAVAADAPLPVLYKHLGAMHAIGARITLAYRDSWGSPVGTSVHQDRGP